MQVVEDLFLERTIIYMRHVGLAQKMG